VFTKRVGTVCNPRNGYLPFIVNRYTERKHLIVSENGLRPNQLAVRPVLGNKAILRRGFEGRFTWLAVAENQFVKIFSSNVDIALSINSDVLNICCPMVGSDKLLHPVKLSTPSIPRNITIDVLSCNGRFLPLAFTEGNRSQKSPADDAGALVVGGYTVYKFAVLAIPELVDPRLGLGGDRED